MTSKPYGVVYCATDISCGKKYIGRTRNFAGRMKSHARTQPLKDLISKNLIEWRVLGECFNEKKLVEKEVFFIKHFKTHKKEFGYNKNITASIPPGRPIYVKKSMDWKEDDYNEISRLAKIKDITWAEMARMIISMGVWAYRAKDK